MRGLSDDELDKVEKDLSALAKSLLETWNEKQPIPELDRFVNNIYKSCNLFLFWSSGPALLPSVRYMIRFLVLYGMRRDWSAEDSKECNLVYFKKVVQNILMLLPNSLKVL